jgi:hypothetical protein
MPTLFIRAQSDSNVEGPFSVKRLRELILQGRLLVGHEVSKDGVSWHSAAKLSGVEWPTDQPALKDPIATPKERPFESPASAEQSEDQGSQSWTPATGVTTHAGEPIDADTDFFSPPPTSIGSIVTASSTLKYSSPSDAPQLRFLMIWFLVVLALTGVMTLGVFTQGWQSAPVQALENSLGLHGVGLLCPTSLLLLALSFALTIKALRLPLVRVRPGLRHRLTYVGEKGIAWYKQRRNPGSPLSETVLLFEDATDLFFRGTDTYQEQFITKLHLRTAYCFSWLDASGKSLLQIKGKISASIKPPWGGEFSFQIGREFFRGWYHFGVSAESAWSVFLLDRLNSQLKECGMMEFDLNKRDVIRVGVGFLEVDIKDQKTRLSQEDITLLTLESGLFQIHSRRPRRSHDASLFGRTGKWSFNYGELANASAFLLALDQIGGFRVQDST